MLIEVWCRVQQKELVTLALLHMIRFNRNRICKEEWFCDGYIDCPWLAPTDETNCGDCHSYWPNRCKCNNEEEFTCETNGTGWIRLTCYNEKNFGKLFN